MTVDNGGPAFPQSMVCTEGGGGIVTSDELDLGGMTLRDYFAAQSIRAALMKAQHNFAYDGVELELDWPHIASSAYDAADAMLAARKGGV